LALKEKDLEKIKIRVEKAILANNKAVEICQSKLEKNGKVLIDVKDFYQMSLKIFQDLYSKIEINVEGDYHGTFLVDKVHFFRINENVIKNSIEADATKLRIICAENKISFFDNGSGMTKDSIESIAKSGTSKKTGHGIGLGSIASFCTDHGYRMKFGNNSEEDIFQTGFHIHLFPNE